MTTLIDYLAGHYFWATVAVSAVIVPAFVDVVILLQKYAIKRLRSRDNKRTIRIHQP
jgi:hypothetical protein